MIFSMYRRDRVRYLTIFSVLLLFGVLGSEVLGQDSTKQDSDPVLIRGKVMYFNPDGSRTVKGDLVIVKGTSRITATEGEYDEKKGQAIARGSVKVTEPGSELTCGELRSFIEEERNLARGHPLLKRTRELAQEDGSVRRSTVVLSAEVIEILDGRKLIRATDRVKLTQNDITLTKTGIPVPEADENVSTVTCNFMEIFGDGNRVVAKGAVQVTSPDFVATGGRIEFFDADQRMEIFGASFGDKAKAWQSVEKGEFAEVARGEVHGRGQHIIYHGRDEILNIIGKARTWRDGERNFVEGEKIIHYVKDNRTVVIGGEGLYYPGSQEEPGGGESGPPTGTTGEEQEFLDLGIGD